MAADPAAPLRPSERASGLRWTSRALGVRLVVAQLLVAATLLGVAWLAQREWRDADRRLTRVYAHRVVPLRSLWEVSDEFAIDFVDAVHKVADGSLAADVGAARLSRVRENTELRFRQAEALMTTPEERAELEAVRPLLEEAEHALAQAFELMARDDRAALHAYRINTLYAGVNPLTARMRRALTRDTASAYAELMALRVNLDASARRGLIGLAMTGLFAIVVGLVVAARFFSSLGQIARVAQTAAAGDLRARVRLRGRDELAEMARHVDHMIEASQQAQQALSVQSESLRASEAEARAASRAKSVFLSNVSHELRTPLNVILGYAQVLERDQGASADQRHGAKRIREAGAHLLELIDDLLGMTRLEANALVPIPKAFSPDALLDDLSRMLEPSARDKGLSFEVVGRGELPKALIADRRRLLQVLLNLAGNAIKFTPSGGVRVCAAYREARLVFEVRDSGPGVAPAERDKLFQSFEQGEQGRRSGEGTGLGLFISQGLVRAMGGDIELLPEEPHGCCFRFGIEAPLADDTRAPEPASQDEHEEKQPAPQPVDVSRLSPDARTHLLELLRAGDLNAASRFVSTQGAEFAPVKAQIDAFHADAVLDKLRLLAREP
ncbi:MAG: ATP-binding protein [Polyangiaceae bacterium]